jgi:hypothetical protein
MRPEERLAVLEAEMRDTRTDLTEIKEDVKTLLAAAHMGHGAWWISVKLGAFILAVLGALAWLYDRLPPR